ncbi:MAG: endonuclease III [Dethiobacter sp.]|jgi:endonuclease-3|nr:endonuclease III [Dethiobacter sp.]
MTKRSEKAGRILASLAKDNPDPLTELKFKTPWQLLVATILSAQSTDRQVNRVTEHLFKKYPGPADMAFLTPEELALDIQGVGLFRNKSRHLVATARDVMEKYSGEVPGTLDELLTLPGVGRKTANVVLSNAFGIPALGVDTHVFRVANRIGLARAKTPEETEKQLTRAIPVKSWSRAHHWLILHGRYVCIARKPKCHTCIISGDCAYYMKFQKQNADSEAYT